MASSSASTIISSNATMTTTTTTSSSSSSSPSCEVILILAHLLEQNSPDYNRHKDKLLDGSVERAVAIAEAALANENVNNNSSNSEVHVVLTGSPRPTFAETNAWLLEEGKGSRGGGGEGGDGGQPQEPSNSETAVQMDVNSDAGLHCPRAKLLQGTIDRPLWDQHRWTDGECLFGEVVERMGLESFSYKKNSSKYRGNSGGGGAEELGLDGMSLKKIKYTPRCLSAYLVTVVDTMTRTKAGSVATKTDTIIDDTTAVEIAKETLRYLRRKKAPLVSRVTIALPPYSPSMATTDEERQRTIRTKLVAAWTELERLNAEMVGEARRMSGAHITFLSL